ncbi:hypothetical protein BH11ARM2_BH11ARM2_21040 [soil metagenome]
MAILDGEPVGCISAARYGDDLGFIGLYIVRPDYRGRGHGIALWIVLRAETWCWTV